MSFVDKLRHCTKQTLKLFFVNYQGGFAMPGGKLRTKEYSTNAYQFLIDNFSEVSCVSWSFSEIYSKWEHNFGVLSTWMRLIMNCIWGQKWTVYFQSNGDIQYWPSRKVKVKLNVLKCSFCIVSNAKHKACWLHANWRQVYGSGYRWKCRLVLSFS